VLARKEGEGGGKAGTVEEGQDRVCVCQVEADAEVGFLSGDDREESAPDGGRVRLRSGFIRAGRHGGRGPVVLVVVN
jgi:hypothetical protein